MVDSLQGLCLGGKGTCPLLSFSFIEEKLGILLMLLEFVLYPLILSLYHCNISFKEYELKRNPSLVLEIKISFHHQPVYKPNLPYPIDYT